MSHLSPCQDCPWPARPQSLPRSGLSSTGTGQGWGPALWLQPENPGPQARLIGEQPVSCPTHCPRTVTVATSMVTMTVDHAIPPQGCGHPMVTECHTTIIAQSLSPSPHPCVPVPVPPSPCPVLVLCPAPCGPAFPHPHVPLSLYPCVPIPVSLSLFPCVPHVPVSLALFAHHCFPVPVPVAPSPVPAPGSLGPHVPVPVSPRPRVVSLLAHHCAPVPVPVSLSRVPVPVSLCHVPLPVSPCPHPVSMPPSSHVPVSPCPCSCVPGPAPRAACPALSRELPSQGLHGLCRVEARTGQKGSRLLPPGWQPLPRQALLSSSPLSSAA